MGFKNSILILVAILLVSINSGCSKGSDPINAPQEEPGLNQGEIIANAQSNRYVLGIWTASVSPDGTSIEAVPNRTSDFLLNINAFLEKAPGSFFFEDIDASKYFDTGRLDVTISMHHPLPGYSEYGIFDTWFVFLHHGADTLNYQNLSYADETGFDSAVVLNPDGFTRWYNFTEFDGMGIPILGYYPGQFANLPDPSAKINPYKIYSDGLEATDDYHTWITTPGNADNRGIFTASMQVNSRRFEIQFPMIAGKPLLLFQYAVITNWEPGDPTLTGSPTMYDPFDFPTNANVEEPFFIRTATDSSDLYYVDPVSNGGTFRADIEVFDWQGGIVGGLGVPNEIESIIIEADFIPGGTYQFTQTELSAVAIPASENSSVFQVEIMNCTPQSSADAGFWVIVEAGGLLGDTYYQGFDVGYPEGVPRASFLNSVVTVAGDALYTIELTSPNGGEAWEVGSHHDITWQTTGYSGLIKLEYSKDGFVSDINEITAGTDDDGTFDWEIPDDQSDTVRVRATLVGAPSMYDESDADFSIVSHYIYVDDSNVSGIEDGTQTYPYNTIQEGVDAATAGYEVWVDDSGNAYTEQVIMATDTILRSMNWDETDGGNRAYIDPPDDPNHRSVDFNGVDNAFLDGFKIGFGGLIEWSMNTQMLRINGGSNNTVQDCLFTGLTDHWGVYPIIITDASDVTIANCRIASIDRGASESGCSNFRGIYADTCPNLNILNNIFADIRSTEDETSKGIEIVYIIGSTNPVVKNNLIHHIIPHAGVGSMGAVLMEGFHFENCYGVEIANNTADRMDSSDAYFINQCFAYVFKECSGVEFTNNIATRIYSSGFPNPLARGVSAFTGDSVVCDYTDIYDIGPGSNGTNYYGDASPGIGAISANPDYIDPDNEEYDISPTSPAQNGDPGFDDWDDAPGDGSRMGCHGGQGGEFVGLLTPE